MVGGDYLARNVQCMAEEGRLSLIAVQRGATGELDLVSMMRKRLTFTTSTLRPRSLEFKTLVAQELERNVWPDRRRRNEAGDGQGVSAGRGRSGTCADGNGRP